MIKTPNRMLTVKQMADEINRSPKTIYRWIEEGFLKNVIRIRDGYKIPATEVNRIKIVVNREETNGGNQ